MMSHEYGWMGGWMGSGLWLWPVLALLLGTLLVVALRKRTSRESPAK